MLVVRVAGASGAVATEESLEEWDYVVVLVYCHYRNSTRKVCTVPTEWAVPEEFPQIALRNTFSKAVLLEVALQTTWNCKKHAVWLSGVHLFRGGGGVPPHGTLGV